MKRLRAIKRRPMRRRFAARLRLVNKHTGREHEQEVYFGDFPIMTSRGTFIVNGVERVVVSQLVRSAGVYFTATPYRGRQLFGAKIIPNRGAWLEFETDATGEISVKIDRRRKVPVTDMFRIFGMSNEQIKESLKDIDTGTISFVDATYKKDAAKDAAESYVEIYRRLRPGDPASAETAKEPDRRDVPAPGPVRPFGSRPLQNEPAARTRPEEATLSFSKRKI